METFTPCDLCKDSGRPGFIYIRTPSQIVMKECQCHIDWKIKAKLKLDAEKANLWSTDEILKYNPEIDYVGEASRKHVYNLKNYIARYKEPAYQEASIYMWGPNGTQKTFLAQWLGIEMLRNKRTVKFMLMNRLLQKLSSNFDSDPELQAFRQELLDVDVLILDESFSKDKVTLYKGGYQLPFLDSFLRERCDALKKGVIYISNNSPQDISEQGFGASIQDLVIRKTKPFNAVFEMKDVYMQLQSSFDISKLFD